MLARHTKWCMCLAQKRCYSAGSSQPHVAVVGGGPGGFYTAQHILKVCGNSYTNMSINVLLTLNIQNCY